MGKVRLAVALLLCLAVVALAKSDGPWAVVDCLFGVVAGAGLGLVLAGVILGGD